MKSLFSGFQSLYPNCTLNATSSTNAQVIIPKTTASEKEKLAEELKKSAEHAKNELRDNRRRLINDYKSKSSDKDANLRFERAKQKEYEDASAKIDTLVIGKISAILGKVNK